MNNSLIGFLMLMTIISPVAFAEEPHPDSVQHLEITFPKALLPGIPMIDEALTMEDAVSLGIENSLGIQVAEAEVGIRKATLLEAKAKRWPVLSIASETFLRGGNSQNLMTPDMFMTTIDNTLLQDFNSTARMPLFTGGKLKGSIRAARFSVEGAQASLKQTVVETAYQIKQAYLLAILSQTEHLVHQQHIQVQETLLKNAQTRYGVGSGLKADVLRIRTEMASAQKMLNEEHIKLNNALYELKAVMGIDMGSSITLTDTLTHHPWTGLDLEALVKQTITEHPQIREAQKDVQEAQAQLTVARSQYSPQVYGQATGSLRLPDRPPMMGNGVIGMLTASLPVFDKSRSSGIAKAQANLKKAQQKVRALELDISKQVAQAWSEYTFAKQNVTLAESAITQAQEDLRLIQKRYEVGRAIVVEVQDAAWQLRQSQLNQAEAIYTHELAKAKLLKASGQVH